MHQIGVDELHRVIKHEIPSTSFELRKGTSHPKIARGMLQLVPENGMIYVAPEAPMVASIHISPDSNFASLTILSVSYWTLRLLEIISAESKQTSGLCEWHTHNSVDGESDSFSRVFENDLALIYKLCLECKLTEYVQTKRLGAKSCISFTDAFLHPPPPIA